jgi:hypothetical protein
MTVDDGDTFGDSQNKAVKSAASFAGLCLICVLLVQFLTLRVTLACDACV